MKRIIMLSALLLAGCGGPLDVSTWTPRTRLTAARETFTATVTALAAYREAGQFTPAESAAITDLMLAGQRSLDRWQAAMILHQQPADVTIEMNRILRELVAARLAAERRYRDG